MIKKIIVIVALLLFVKVDSDSQILDAISGALSFLSEASQKVLGAVDESSSLKQAMELVDLIVCQKQKFDFYAELSADIKVCDINVDYKIAMVKYNIGLLQLSLAAAQMGTGFFAKNQIKSTGDYIKDGIQELQESLESMEKYNIMVSGTIRTEFLRRTGNPYMRNSSFSTTIDHI